MVVTAALCAVLGMMVLFWVCFKLGTLHSAQTLALLMEKEVSLAASNQAFEAQVHELQQKITNFSVGASVDRQTNEQLRQEIVSLQTQVTELEADIRFYRRLMAPESDERGLQIGDVELTAIPNTEIFRYRVTALQVSRRHKPLRGRLSVDFIGTIHGESKRIGLEDLSQTVETSSIPLRFTYFQVIEGILKMPKGWLGHQIEVSASSTSPKKKSVSKRIDWPTSVE